MRLKTAFVCSEYISTEELPPLVKSTPIHLDPKLRFRKRAKTVKISNPKLKHLAKVNSVINQCIETASNESPRVENRIQATLNSSANVYAWVERLCESTKFGVNENLAGIISLHKDNARLDKTLKDHSSKIREELNSLTANLVKSARKRRLSLDA